MSGGDDCGVYRSKGYCGGFGLLVGASYNYPEKNCCGCGKEKQGKPNRHNISPWRRPYYFLVDTLWYSFTIEILGLLGIRPTACLPWTTPSPGRTCVGGESYINLNASMTISDLENCGSLCKKYVHHEGCCLLDNNGCHWKEGATPTEIKPRTVTQCSPAGMFVKV